MTADKLADALRCGRPRCECARKSGASLTAHCPNTQAHKHADRAPSLSVTGNLPNLPLVHCFTGCSQEEVIGALQARDLWPSAPSRKERKPRLIEVRYPAHLASGKPLNAEHVRLEKPNGKKEKMWWERDGEPGLKGLEVADLALWRADTLADLPDGARVTVCEGEKTAEALTVRGIVAAGSVTGAAATPGDDALAPLVRLSVLLWPDADAVGREHMARVAAALLRLGCADVRLLDWPDAPDKGDAADFTGTDEELATLLDGAQPIEATPTPDGAEVLDSVRAFIRRYVAMGDAEADALTLWAAHSHAIEGAEATAYLFVHSAEKGSGKTKTLETLAHLTAKPWLTSRTSPAVLVRKLDRDGPTLLLDETDAAFRDGGEYGEVLRAVLNAGNRRGGVASLCVKAGGDFELRDFSVFGAKAFAGIGAQHLPETIRDRSISIELRRRAPGETISRFRRREVESDASPIRDALARWAASVLDCLRDARPEIPDALGDRDGDGWEPLLAIADAAGGDWRERARSAALALSCGDAREDDSLGVRLLKDVRTIFDELKEDQLSSAGLVAVLIADDDAPWGDLRGKPLDARSLSKLLRRYHVKPQKHRRGAETFRGYDRADFLDAWGRYCPVPISPEQAEQAEQAEQNDTPKYERNGPDVPDVPNVPVNPGMREHGPNAYAPCGASDIDGYTPGGEPRCEAHYVKPTDGALVREAVGMGFPITVRRQWGAISEWRLCCDDQAEGTCGNGDRRPVQFRGDITATGDDLASPIDKPRELFGDA